MKKHILLLIIVAALCTGATAQKKYAVYAVGFYNQENLFDTCHDEGKRDYEFLPNGSYKWNGLKYEHKLRNMARALADMGTDILKNVGCAFIGLSEVENARVLTDLVAQGPLKNRGMQFVHIEGPDRRGVDCALLYNPALFTVQKSTLQPYVQELEKDSAFYTRGFLTVEGTLAGESVAVIVCHLPSRFSTSFYRESGARQMRILKDSLLMANPSTKVFIMGDMNDYPTDRSMHEVLGAKEEIALTGDGEMYNPWYNLLAKQGIGTLSYQGSWNLFDQIVMTPNLLDRTGKKDFSSLTYWKNRICKFDYLLQTEGKYKGSPKRTTAGGVWLDGFSDHLPVVVYLIKEQK